MINIVNTNPKYKMVCEHCKVELRYTKDDYKVRGNIAVIICPNCNHDNLFNIDKPEFKASIEDIESDIEELFTNKYNIKPEINATSIENKGKIRLDITVGVDK